MYQAQNFQTKKKTRIEKQNIWSNKKLTNKLLYIPLPQTDGKSCWNHWICVSNGPLFHILLLRPIDWKKSALRVVAPIIAMLAPFWKLVLLDFDGGSSGKPKYSAAWNLLKKLKWQFLYLNKCTYCTWTYILW